MFVTFCRYRSCSDILRVYLKEKGDNNKKKKARAVNHKLGKADATIGNSVYLVLNFMA